MSFVIKFMSLLGFLATCNLTTDTAAALESDCTIEMGPTTRFPSGRFQPIPSNLNQVHQDAKEEKSSLLTFGLASTVVTGVVGYGIYYCYQLNPILTVSVIGVGGFIGGMTVSGCLTCGLGIGWLINDNIRKEE